MADFKPFKVVASLPSTLEPDALYLVRVGAGFDLYATNGVGEVNAYKLNESGSAFGKTPWDTKAIGEEVWLDDSNPAVDVPPTNSPNFRYIKLTAGENGHGGYNEGVLINETVSGSAPLIEATAKVNLLGSPFHGQTVRLLNTERLFIRAGESGVLQDGQLQSHGHTGSALSAGAHTHTQRGASQSSTNPTNTVNRGSGSNNNTNLGATSSAGAHAHTLSINSTGGIETRPRNIGRTVYMRIL